ncbi:SDR family NAD(P)-dependent oxidoreductase [Halorubrum sp. 48-1-W]|uniref:SDR family NAD(P)-dependent oxidoreductase n=1 Tax=Halorubrum sp. 48-1-W TaxID=2249761 RepID=UPI000DCB62B2|nr:SDR family NAD(P)-dependent oxidoreductase [Halorubrum sp. 48-1-W]RAW44967.1 SDR family NAD(P)-dependent oxidoreductase [Halorubrum sp. 48-1-W]
MEINGDTALVTGGGRGIGRAICTKLASRGLDVVVADIDDDGMAETEAELEAHGVRTLSVHTDVSDEASVRDAVTAAEAEFDAIDVLVNNAGIAGPTKDVEDVTVEEWDATLGVNLRGAFLLSRELMGKMKERGYGRIVNISSASGKRPVPQRSPYTASKSGLLGLTRTLAVEGGPHDVNANAVCPGSVAGPRIDRVIEHEAEARGLSAETVADEKRAKSPRNEFVQPEDVAETVAYLCSTAADRVTGQSLNVSAGKVTY